MDDNIGYIKLRYRKRLFFVKYARFKGIISFRADIDGISYIIVNRNLNRCMRSKLFHKLLKNKNLVEII